MSSYIKNYNIEALPIHKEICSYLIDNRISFHCYNGGLQMITIKESQPYHRIHKGTNFMEELVQKFGLVEVRRTTKDIFYELKEKDKVLS